MKTNLLAQVYAYEGIKDTDMDLICEKHEQVIISKNDFLLTEGKVANAFYIVESGFVRSYLNNFEGNDITINFAGPGEIAIEVASIFQRIPTRENMQAVTDITAWKISFTHFQELFTSIPALPSWGREWMAGQLFLAKKRAADMITESAAQRYRQLLLEKPAIVQQVPLKFIASYLGITDTSLSRIRKELSHL